MGWSRGERHVRLPLAQRVDHISECQQSLVDFDALLEALAVTFECSSVKR